MAEVRRDVTDCFIYFLEIKRDRHQNFDKLAENVKALLLNLSEKDKAARGVAWAMKSNFDKLPEDLRNNLLLKLAEKDKAALTLSNLSSSQFIHLFIYLEVGMLHV